MDIKNTSNKLLLSLSLKNDGDWDKIFLSVKNKKIENDTSLADNFNYDCNYITIIDDDEHYPNRLKEICNKPPFVLFYKGDLSLLKQTDKIISVIGGRNCSVSCVNDLSKVLDVPHNDLIVLYGGKEKAINDLFYCYKKKILVLPSGFIGHEQVINEVVNKGGLVLSEYPPNVAESNFSCVARNRIIEALTNKTLVSDISGHSGNMIRVSYALNYNNELYVIPKSIDSSYANNNLIKEGAILATDWTDIFTKEALNRG